MPPTLFQRDHTLLCSQLIARNIGIGREKTFTYPAVIWYPIKSLFPQPTADLFSLTKRIASGDLFIPKKLVDMDERAKARTIVDLSRMGSEGFVTKKDWDGLVSELLDSRVYLANGKLAPASDSQLGMFANYILCKAGIRWDDRSNQFTGKDVLKGIKGANADDRLRVILSGMEGLLYGIVTWEPKKDFENPVKDFVKHIWDCVDKYMRLEMWNIRGEHYGLAEETELTMRRMLSGSFARYRVISRAVNNLERRSERINVKSVTDELISMNVAPSTFRCKRSTENYYLKEAIFKILNPARLISYSDCQEDEDDYSRFVPVYKPVLEISDTIARISVNDLAVATMGRPQALTLKHLEGYSTLLVMRDELMVALGKVSNGKDNGVFTAKEAELLDILFFSDLPLENEDYSDQSDWITLCKLRAELEFTKSKKQKEEINSRIKSIKAKSYIEVPEVKGAFSSPHYGLIKQVPLKGFKNTWINRSAYKLALSTLSEKGIPVTGRALAMSIDFARKFVFKIRSHGFLDPNSSKCIPCIRGFYLGEHGLSDDYNEVVPEINYGPSVSDLSENSEWRKVLDLNHWALRQRTITKERVLRTI